MVELFDIEKLDEEQVIKLQEDCALTGLYMMGHYVLDYPWIITQVCPYEHRVIADVGGGLGVLQYTLAQTGHDVWNFDRIAYIKKLDNVTENLYFMQGDLGNEDFFKYTPNSHSMLGRFDYVISCSAIEHNLPAHVNETIKNMKRLMKPKGKMILTLPFAKKLIVTDNMIYFDKNYIELLAKQNGLKIVGPDNWNDFDVLYNKFKKSFNFEDNFIAGGVVLENE